MESNSTALKRNVWLSVHNIPLEICREILRYLPAKSLVCFRIVSRIWKSIIEDPDFIREHLQHCTKNRLGSSFIVRETMPRFRTHQWVLRCSKTLQKLSEIKSPVEEDIRKWDVLSARDGLLLLLKRKKYMMSDELILWNPSIEKSVCIDPPYNCSFWVLGFDPSNNDYKVVGFNASYIFTVYSLKNRSWVKFPVVKPLWELYLPCEMHHDHVSLGKYIHWLGITCSPAESSVEVLVSLDLTSMKISITPTTREAMKMRRRPETRYQQHSHETNGALLLLRQREGLRHLLVTGRKSIYTGNLKTPEMEEELHFLYLKAPDYANAHVESLVLLN